MSLEDTASDGFGEHVARLERHLAGFISLIDLQQFPRTATGSSEQLFLKRRLKNSCCELFVKINRTVLEQSRFLAF